MAPILQLKSLVFPNSISHWGGMMVASGQGTMMVSRKGNYLLPLTPVGPLCLGLALLFGHLHEGWLQAFYQLGHSIWQLLT